MLMNCDSQIIQCFNFTMAAHTVLLHTNNSGRPIIQRYLVQALMCWGRYVTMSHGVLYLGNDVSDMLTSIDETLPGMTESIFDDWFIKNAGVLADKFLGNEGDYREVEECLCYLENSLKFTYENIDCNRRWWLMRDSGGDFISLQIERD